MSKDPTLDHDTETVDTDPAETTPADAPPRRRFLKNSAGAGIGFFGATLLGACGGDSDSAAAAQGGGGGGGPTDAQILNFALNLEYLEAAFYLQATGQSVPQWDGNGTGGTVLGGRAVPFQTRAIKQYAQEIAEDEKSHVQFLRTALGSAKVAAPTIDIRDNTFTALAQAAGINVGALGGEFDPYASETNFLLAAYIFEDVGVTAYKGAARLIDSDNFLEAAAGILGAEAYHAGLIRTALYSAAQANPNSDLIINATEKISNLRDTLDDPNTMKDQGLTKSGTANIVPTDQFAKVFGRTPSDVLNIVFFTQNQAKQGGFFPNGVNGFFDTSSAP